MQIWEHGSKTRRKNSNTGYQHRTSQKKRSSRKSVDPSDSRYRRSAQTLGVRGRVVFVVLRSGDDDHDTDELAGALPLARFLPSHSRGLTGFDDQGAVETGRGRIGKPLPPRTYFSLSRRDKIVLVLVVVLVLDFGPPSKSVFR